MPVSLPVPRLVRPATGDKVRLPGMEVLGFYDEPYQVAVSRPPRPLRAAATVTSTHRPPPAANSTARVSALWETTEVSASALEWWKPHVVARRKLGGRRTRLSSMGTGGLIGVILFTLVVLAVQRPGRVAEESLGMMRADAAALLESLPPLEAVVISIGRSDVPDLSASTAATLAAESAARALFADAGGLIDETRDDTVTAASGMLEVTSRTNRLIAYRLAAESAFIRPSLPTAPDETDLPSATEAVASWRAEVETSLGDLASDVLPEHRATIDEWLGTLGTWQTTYLDTLRQADAVTMAAAVEDLEGQIARLHEELLAELADAGGDLLSQLADSRRTVERLLRD